MDNIIKVGVTKQMDGITFSIMPQARALIKHLVPHARPVNTVFVAYDTKSDFETYLGTLEKWILPALLGIGTSADLNQIALVEFVDTDTGQSIHQIIPHDEEIQPILG